MLIPVGPILVARRRRKIIETIFVETIFVDHFFRHSTNILLIVFEEILPILKFSSEMHQFLTTLDQLLLKSFTQLQQFSESKINDKWRWFVHKWLHKIKVNFMHPSSHRHAFDKTLIFRDKTLDPGPD